MKLVFLAGLLAAATFAHDASSEEKDGVTSLTAETFDSFIESHQRVFVKFYAPWCGHCKSMAPAYARLAKRMEAESREIAVVKVDAASESELAQRFAIQGFPTLKLFIGGTPVDYKGGREEEEMYTWLVKRSEPAATQVTLADADKIDAERLAVVYLLPEGDEAALADFQKLANSYDNVHFHYTHDNALRDRYDAHEQFTFMVVRSFDEGRKYLVDKAAIPFEEMRGFFEGLRHPQVMEFGQEAAERIFGSENSAIFFFTDKPAQNKGLEAFRAAAKSRAGKIIFSLSSITTDLGAKLAEFIGVTSADESQVRVIKFSNGTVKKFKCQAETAEAVEQCVDDFEKDALKAYYKSEPVPAPTNEAVKVVVGDNFQEVVLDSDAHVLLEAYAPWCGHCKKLAPIYEKVGQRLAGVKDVIIAKMDASANEHPAIEVKGFPTIKFFRKGAKDAPVDFEGDRTEKGFLDFLVRETGLTLDEPKAEGEL